MSIKNVSVNIIFITICLQRTERDRFKYREEEVEEFKNYPKWVELAVPTLHG